MHAFSYAILEQLDILLTEKYWTIACLIIGRETETKGKPPVLLLNCSVMPKNRVLDMAPTYSDFAISNKVDCPNKQITDKIVSYKLSRLHFFLKVHH